MPADIPDMIWCECEAKACKKTKHNVHVPDDDDDDVSLKCSTPFHWAEKSYSKNSDKLQGICKFSSHLSQIALFVCVKQVF